MNKPGENTVFKLVLSFEIVIAGKKWRHRNREQTCGHGGWRRR